MASSQDQYRLIDVCKSFSMDGKEIRVLQSLSIQLPPNRWIALTGPSGCGKTTLLHLLGGLDRPTSGAIFLGEQDITKLSPGKLTQLRAKTIGFVFQSYHLLPELSALENAVLPALHWGTDRQAAYSTAQRWLESFGLGTRLHHRPRELSGGEQQRVAIARALINSPDIILADEPTGNLDSKAAQEIVDILRHVQEEKSQTLIMVTHDLALAKQADMTIELKKEAL